VVGPVGFELTNIVGSIRVPLYEWTKSDNLARIGWPGGIQAHEYRGFESGQGIFHDVTGEVSSGNSLYILAMTQGTVDEIEKNLGS